MKRTLIFIFLATSLLYSQELSSQKLLKLENDIKTPGKNISGMERLNYQQNFKKKNVGLAIVFSLMLPGMGELYADNYSSGKYFTIADAALWGTYLGMRAYGNNKKDDYKAFAASEGGVNNNGKDDTYYATIGDYLNIDDFNNEKALQRRFDEMYDTQQFYWNWKTTSNRRTYRGMWTSSESAFNNLRFVAGALILNRVISAINAVRLVVRYNKRQSEELGWNISVGVHREPTLPTSLTFNFQTKF